MSEPAVVVFDGRCPLCRGTVGLLRGWTRPGALRFAPARSQAGRKLCLSRSIDPEQLSAVLLVTDSAYYQGSDAVWRAAARLRWPWRVLEHIRWCPQVVREFVYGLVARHRPR